LAITRQSPLRTVYSEARPGQYLQFQDLPDQRELAGLLLECNSALPGDLRAVISTLHRFPSAISPCHRGSAALLSGSGACRLGDVVAQP
jgi:hypothetical protein